jgi:hypothetical protein
MHLRRRGLIPCKPGVQNAYSLCMEYILVRTEAEFLDVLGQKSLEFSFLLFTVTCIKEFYYPPPPFFEQKWFETDL